MGFLEDLTAFVWNWTVFCKQRMAIDGCFAFGSWGLFFDDDDGAMMLWCMELFGGVMVEYPAYFESSYAAA